LTGGHLPAGPTASAGPGWLFWPFLLTVLGAPALLGANRPAAWSLLALSMGGLLIAWAAATGAGRRGAAPVPLRRLAPATVPFLIAVAWAALQTAPVPQALRDPVWTHAGAALGLALGNRVSLAPEEAWTGIMRLLGYGAVLLLATQFGHSARRESAMLWGFALAGGAYALYGLIVWFDGNDTILWMAKWAYAESLTSTFVSRNSYATFAGLGLCASLALLAGSLGQRSQQAAANQAAALLVLALLITGALLLTGSRGGAGATLFAVVAMGAIVALGPLPRRARLVFAMSALAMLAASAAVLGSGLVRRLTPEAFEAWGGRSQIWSSAAGAILDRPLGGGLGAFADFAPAYRRLAPGLQVASIDKAHNLYLELAAELGLPVAAALVAGLGWLALRAMRASLRSPAGAPLAAAGGSVLVGAHSLVDFSLQIPAVTASWLLILGAALGGIERAQATAAPRPGTAHTDRGAPRGFRRSGVAAADR
jgi:O-antigen ligase